MAAKKTTTKTNGASEKHAAPAKPAPVRQLFGTDGIRGTANEWPMTPEIAMNLGKAVAHVARQGTRFAHVPRILIGKDTRLSGYMIEQAIAAGITSMGARVILCGPIPTPAVAQLTVSMRADAGIVISASHNPYQDNGIKIFGPDGFKLPDEREAEIERLMATETLARPTGPGIGKASRLEDAGGRYVVFAKTTFPRGLTLDGVRIVVDAAHGAAYKVAPLVFTELGGSVTSIGVKPNGVNINKDAGALHPDNVRAEVVKKYAQIGIALDGDADRLIVIDEKGQIVDGDVVMAMCASRLLDDGQLGKNTLVATVMSNLGLERAMEARGAKLVRTQVGDRYVVEAMRKNGYNLGGEQSGHLIFLDHASTGDGIVAALQVLAIMVRTGRPLSELAKEAMERVPQVLENVTLPARRPLDEMKTLSASTAKVTKELGDDGRVLIRWSGTEPKLRIMLEGPDEDQLRIWAKDLAGAAQKDARA
ncbi:MAG: phosphoglucosamine mutase [Labilithrix sp.]|nr:phosphoglucosamine mutase [Labilithrix sp.]MCW5814762.1 phosphoglucosamine mutase [Labilithrix sp.]